MTELDIDPKSWLLPPAPFPIYMLVINCLYWPPKLDFKTTQLLFFFKQYSFLKNKYKSGKIHVLVFKDIQITKL